jgi:hypothetical protein
MGEIETNKLA